MNIALSAVIIFILLLPPIAFYLSFNFGRFPKAGPKLGLLEGLMLSAIFSVVLHSLGIAFLGTEIRFDILALLIGGDLKTFNTLTSNSSFKVQFQQFTWYSLCLVTLALLAGRLSRRLITYFRWHASSELFRIYNHWWYLFQGYKVDDFIGSGKRPAFDIVFMDVLVNTNSGTMIYSGFLIDYVCDGEKLDRIYLSETIKREFKRNEMNDRGNILVNEPGGPKEIDGNTMVIPYNSIINMNLHFVTLPVEFKTVSESDDIQVVPV